MTSLTAEPNRWATHFLALVLLSTMSCALFARDLFVDNSIVFQDEYVYKVSADRLLDQTLVLERGLSLYMPNRLFLAVYGVCTYFGSNAYAIAQFLNVLFWALGLGILYRLAALCGLSLRRSLAFMAVTSLLPLSTYTKYFMPEAMFFGLFCASVYALMFGIESKRSWPVVAAGVLVALLYFVKPHAIALMGVNVFFLLLLPGRLRLIALFCAGLLPVFGLGRWFWPAPSGGASLGFYQQLLEGVFGTLAKSGVSMAKIVFEVGAGNALFWLCSFALTLLLVISVLLPKLRLLQRGVEVPRSLWAMALYLLISGLALVGMSVVFTALVGDVGRIHSRYYFFVYPLALLLLFQFDRVQLTLGGKVVGLVLAVGGPVLFLVFTPDYWWLLYMSVVGDGPELGFAFFSRNALVSSVVATVLAGAWTVWRPQRLGVLVMVFALTSVISTVYAVASHKGMFRGPLTTGREAIAVEEFLGREKMVSAVVVGEQRDMVTKFLFNLSTTPNIQELAAGANLDQIATSFPKSTHVIALSESYVLPTPLFQCAAVGLIRVCTINR